VGPRADLDEVAKRKNSALAGGINPLSEFIDWAITAH
jgi:hypothetical protein